MFRIKSGVFSVEENTNRYVPIREENEACVKFEKLLLRNNAQYELLFHHTETSRASLNNSLWATVKGEFSNQWKRVTNFNFSSALVSTKISFKFWLNWLVVWKVAKNSVITILSRAYLSVLSLYAFLFSVFSICFFLLCSTYPAYFAMHSLLHKCIYICTWGGGRSTILPSSYFLQIP